MLRYVKGSWKLHSTFEKGVDAAWEETASPEVGVSILIFAFSCAFLKYSLWVGGEWCLRSSECILLKIGTRPYLLLQTPLRNLKNLCCYIFGIYFAQVYALHTICELQVSLYPERNGTVQYLAALASPFTCVCSIPMLDLDMEIEINFRNNTR